MAESHKYSDEFKQKVISEYHSGTPTSALVSKYGVSQTAVSKWIKQYATVEAEGGIVLTAKQVIKLQKRISILEKENEILKKANAIFAQHSDND